MALKVELSFKKNEKHIYDYVDKQLSPSIYLKELIIKDMESQKVNKDSKKNTNLLDF